MTSAKPSWKAAWTGFSPWTPRRPREQPVGFKITSPTELSYPADNPHHLDFNGAMGAYYREIYFYIPWLIARALRADGKYQDALSWYGRICDFTAHDSDHDTRLDDRPWRYIEFRELTVPKLKAMLTDKAAITKLTRTTRSTRTPSPGSGPVPTSEPS